MSTTASPPNAYPESGPSRLPISAGDMDGSASASVTASAQKRRHVEGEPAPKNLQACDRCRTKKTKCEPRDTTRDQCRACYANSLTCTFDLPLTASRTKRIRRGLSLVAGTRSGAGRQDEESDQREEESESGLSPTPAPAAARSRNERFRLKPTGQTSTRREGPTSLNYILHAAPTLPLFILEQYDTDHDLSLQRRPSNSGDGYIEATHRRSTSSAHDTASPVLEAMSPESWNEIVNKLVDTFVDRISPLLPIVSREDVGETGELLRYAMAGVMAGRSNIPREIFDALRYIVNREIAEQDTLSDFSRQSLQTLLVTCLVDELAPVDGSVSAQSVSRTRLTAAIRMAQDLSYNHANADLRDRRLWESAMIMDQWNASRHGTQPILSPSDFEGRTPHSPKDSFFTQLFTLTHLLARIIHIIYGPIGITQATNATLDPIAVDLKAWRDKLPESLRLTGFGSPLAPGILHLLHTAVLILLYRPFMRWSFIVTPSLNINLDLPVWAEIHVASRAALGWAAMQEDVVDLLFFGPYALGLSAFMQYHSWARRREWNGVVTLEKICKEGVDKWLARWPQGHLPIQRAQLDLIALLHQATERLASSNITSFDNGPRGLNPTPGSLNRIPEMPINGITFLRDPSHPKGGILVATQQAAREIKDLPPGTVIIGGPPPPDDHTANANGGYNGLGNGTNVIQNPLESLAALAGGADIGSFPVGMGTMNSNTMNSGYNAATTTNTTAGAGTAVEMRTNTSPMDWDAFVAAFGFDGLPVLPS